ncbi:hypothetical protein DFP93_106179 [Aneurinibacillus soli]|uniref:Uncharacterized protein n=1 Tax=Aneurinibacillus soli TaxID=1500254 RepID=A0A0U5BHL0_9BACL|nr:hypothetical protein DFP93_106179 [Aneurinibacillus soli]BAU29799.1 hypothetical protein CB4_04036 [Aneurinibacillus soli]
MHDEDVAEIENCMRILRRIAWNIQYREKKRRKKELSLEEYIGNDPTSLIISNLYLHDLLNKIPSKQAKYIIQSSILYGFTEKEIAVELNMTQQGVNKCKKKWLKSLQKDLLPFLQY